MNFELLDRLQRLVSIDPKASRLLANELALRPEPKPAAWRFRAFLLAANANRSAGDYRTSRAFLALASDRIGEILAGRERSQQILRLCSSWVSLFRDQRDFESALSANAEQLRIAAGHSKQEIGRALVDLAMVYLALRDWRAAYLTASAALRIVEEDDSAFLAAAKQALIGSIADSESATPAKLEECLQELRNMKAKGVGAIRIEWSRGRILACGANYDDAARCLREASLRFQEADLFTEAALSGLDCAISLTALGFDTKALAGQLFPTLSRLRCWPEAVAAFQMLRGGASREALEGHRVRMEVSRWGR